MPPIRLDTFALNGVLSPGACARLVAEMRDAGAAEATVTGTASGATVRGAVRKVLRVTPPPASVAAVTRELEGRRPQLEQHFGVELGVCEPPQFLRYRTGDFFVAHQDGNTPLIHDATLGRRISVVLFLNEQAGEPREGTFTGGDLVLHGAYPQIGLRERVEPRAGTLVAFRAETTHEVVPLTAGERYTVVSWYRAPDDEPEFR